MPFSYSNNFALIRLFNFLETRQAPDTWKIFLQIEQPKRTMANWMPDSVKKAVFSKKGYNQYGLYHDDLYVEDDEDVHEALRRLPPQLQASLSVGRK